MPPPPPSPPSPPRGGAIDRWIARYVDFAVRHTRLLLVALAVLAVAGLVPASQLELHTDMAELLPEEHPAVVALRRIAGRQKSSTNLIILLESPSAAVNERFAEALRPQLEAMVPSVFSEVQWRADPEIPAFAEKWKWLYAELAELQRAEALLDRLILRRAQPLMVDLDDLDPEEELRKLRAQLEQKLPPQPRAKYFVGEEGSSHLLGIMLWRRSDGLATLDDKATLEAVQEVVRRAGPASVSPHLQVHYTGHIAMAIDEHNAVRDDLTLATILCVTAVLLIIYLYFRRVGILWVVGAPAVLGLILALAVARFTILYLNANTAFLISIILGNGINSPIILMARYGEDRRAGREVSDALAAAMSGTLLGTGSAMAAASIAYGSLLFTSFRGFSQFGIVGGSGMLLVWIFTFLLVPPMVILGERLRPGLLTPRPNLLRRPFAWLGGLAARRPVGLAVLALGLVAICGMPLARFLRDPMEWNFAKLRSRETRSQQNWARMHRLGMGAVGAGHIATDGVLLVDRPEQADAVAEALRAQDRDKGKDYIIKAVRTINSVLPSQQEDKLAILSRLRDKMSRHTGLMSEEERREVERFRPPQDLRPVTVEDLPRQVRESFTEVGGERGRLVGIDATNFNDWDGHDLLRLARAMRVEALGKTWVAASVSTVFAGMLETIIRDAPRVTLAALCGVALLVLLSFGWRGAIPIGVSLLVGMVWLGGLMSWLDLKVNFVNFVALPITLGVGADYAANIWARIRQEGTGNLAAIIGETGTAVALCSATTIIGYSSLLFAGNRALQSFGLVADLGEVTCLAAALMVLPALVRVLWGRRAGDGQPRQ